MKKALWLCSILMSVPHLMSALMSIQIISAPQLTPLLDTIYITGSFNNWNPSDPAYQCVPNTTGWSVAIEGEESTPLEFKFTRGSWSTVEGNEMGNYIPNRQAILTNDLTLEVVITGWEDIAGMHTVTPNVRILDSNFWIPELNRSRRVWISLPENYSPDHPGYPVLYMMDGQNVFDTATSFAGEWEVDESTFDMAEESCRDVVIVAIDNGGSQRLDEYSPWLNTDYNEGGEGIQFAAFLAETLKPFIDTHYNTLSDAEHTTIAGSSLGALIATYVLCAYPSEFGHGAMFSPAYWFNSEIFDYASQHPLSISSRIYFVSGTTESDDMVPDMQLMESTMQGAGFGPPFTNLITHADGAHSEWYWRREFPAAFEWLTQCAEANSLPNIALQRYRLYPNPTADSVVFELPNEAKCSVQILDAKGVPQHLCLINHKSRLDLSTYPAGSYLFVIRSLEGTILHQETIIKQ